MATTRTDSAPGIDPHIGRVLGGRYKVLSKLGEGGIGAVYKGLQVNLEQHVAIKIMKPEVSTDEVLVARFNNEARIYARIKSPYVVKIHDFGQEPSDKILYLVMEFLPGVDLRQMLRREGTMRASRMCGLLVQILEGLGAAHALGIVHRDVKPANIMIQGAETDSPFARILDFGVSKVDADPLDAVPADMNTQEGFEMGLTLPGAFSGTPVYMSPEQCRGAELDHRSDIYAAGVLMYEMACGQPPFSATTALALLTKHVLEAPEPPSRIASHPIPHALDDLIMRCLEKDPDNRPASVRVLIEDLQAIASDASNPDLVPLLDLSDRFTDVPLPVSTKAFGGQAQPADPSAVAVVRELLRTLGLAYKNYVTYPKDNPIFRNVAEQVCGMLDRYFESRETLDLSVDRFAVLFNKERVYEDTDLRVSYPFKLFSDGIRKLAFHRGIGQTELSAYLECLHLASSSPAHTADLVTLMWERRFEHITYHLVDDLIHEGLPEGDELAAEVAEGAIATDARYRGLARNTMPRTAMHAASGTSMEPSPAADHPTLEPMSAKELADLEMLVSEAEQRDDTDEFVRAVFEALGRADDTRETEALLKILDNVAEASLRMGDVEHLLTILNPARALLKHDVPEAIAKGLQGIITHASEPRHVKNILDQLRRAEDKMARQKIASALALLSPNVVDTILEHLDRFDSEWGVPALQLALLMHCKQDPERLRPGLDSGRPQVVRAAVRIVTETGSPRAIELLTPLLSRGSAEVKLDVIEALVKLRDPRLVFHLQPLLEDEDGRVRTAVIASWSGADPDAAARPLLAILEDEHFAERPHGEKATLFRVLGQLGGERVIRAMERVLFAQPRGLMVSIAVQVGIIALAGAGMTAGLVVGLGTGLGLAVGLGIVVATIVGIVGRAALARTRHTEFIEPAAMCLRAVGDEDALAVLREAAEKGPGKTRRICNRVMKIAATRGTE